MQCRDIRLLAVADDGGTFASDGARRIDRLDGSWLARWQELPDHAKVVAIDVINGDVLACDAGNNCIWRIGSGGVHLFAGRPQPPSLDRRPQSVDGPLDVALFGSPTAMTVVDGSILVAEIGTGGPRMRLVGSSGVTTCDVVGAPDTTIDALSPSMSGAFAIRASDTSPVVVHVHPNHSDGVFVARILAGSLGEHGEDDGRTGAARFARPTALCRAPSGGCHVADGARVRLVSRDGTVTTLAGGMPGLQDGTGAEARFGAIRAIALDASRSIFVADADNDALRSVDAGGTVTSVIGGPGAPVINQVEAKRRNKLFSRALVDSDVAEAWALARGFLADHTAKRHKWPDRTIQPVSAASARMGKDLAARWSESSDPVQARLGGYCLWLILCEERGRSVDDIRDARLLRLGRELAEYQ